MDERQSDTHIVRGVAEVATPQADRYLVQLCKHFAHKRPVTFDERSGHIAFSAGDCHLAAADGVLRLTVAAPDESQLAQVQDVVARHLLRFSFREEMPIEWRAA